MLMLGIFISMWQCKAPFTRTIFIHVFLKHLGLSFTRKQNLSPTTFSEISLKSGDISKYWILWIRVKTIKKLNK